MSIDEPHIRMFASGTAADVKCSQHAEPGCGSFSTGSNVFFSAHKPGRSTRRTIKAAPRELLSLASSTGLPVIPRLGYTTLIALTTAKPSLDRLRHAVHFRCY